MSAKQMIPYLVFPGSCREAMEFYHTVLGGEITMMTTFGESPMEVPEEVGNRIFNSELKTARITLKASDDMPGYEVVKGTNISLYLSFDSSEAKKQVFDQFAEGGKILFPIEDNFGMVTDKYGVQWMVVDD